MSEARELALINLDEQASEPRKPVGIITADKPGTREFDDGIAVTPLPAAEETYRVSVFAVDTSALYCDDAIAKQVVERARTTYEDLPDGGRLRHPMLDPEVTRDMHFSANNGICCALVVSFIVGRSTAPSQVTISSGEVEVLNNYPYATFGGMCRDRAAFKRYGRAAALILSHMGEQQATDPEIIYRNLIYVPREAAIQRGERITRAYTVCTGGLVARVMDQEQRLAIFRTNYPAEGKVLTKQGQVPAEFSITAGPHDGLALPVYSRVTSPLWRGEDFMMHGLLDAREKGRDTTLRDVDLIFRMIDRLNQLKAPQEALKQPA